MENPFTEKELFDKFFKDFEGMTVAYKDCPAAIREQSWNMLMELPMKPYVFMQGDAAILPLFEDRTMAEVFWQVKFKTPAKVATGKIFGEPVSAASYCRTYEERYAERYGHLPTFTDIKLRLFNKDDKWVSVAIGG